MSQVITLFEYDQQQADAFSWTHADSALLEKLQGSTGGVAILREVVYKGRPTVQATQYAGVLRLGHRTFQILPKMYRGGLSAQEQAREATANLLHLLSYTVRMPVHEQAIARLLRQQSDWFEILTHLFARHLTEEWQRGAYRGYNEVDENLGALKGKWRISDQLRRPEVRHRFEVSHDVFGADNRLNRVFRFVVERLWRLTRDLDNRRRLERLREWLDEVALLPLMTVEQAPPTLITRLNNRYEPLLNLARLFLDGGALQLTAGSMQSFALVFDMNRLFEDFVAEFVRRHRDSILPLALLTADMLIQTAGATRHLAQREDGKLIFNLKPDIAFRRNRDFLLLIDTKYKKLEPERLDLGVAGSDFYQMYAYAHAYDCSRVLLLYPEMDPLTAPLCERLRLDADVGVKQVWAATVDLRLSLGHEGRGKLIERLRNLLHTMLVEEELGQRPTRLAS